MSDVAPSTDETPQPLTPAAADERGPAAEMTEEEALATLPNVRVVRQGDRTFYLLGTAHVSPESVAEVGRAVEVLRPDVVGVELDEQRYLALTDADQWRRLDIFKVLKEGKTLFLLANLALAGFQRRLGAKFGSMPGHEFLAATRTADELGIPYGLVDRNVHITLKRTWSAAGFFTKVKLSNMLAAMVFGADEDISIEDLEAQKSDEGLVSAHEMLVEHMPEAKVPFVDERDVYMVTKLEALEGDRVLAIVGAMHVPGMSQAFGNDTDLAPLEELPPPKLWTKLLKWIIPLIVIGAFFFGISDARGRSAQELIFAWVLPNSVMAALLTLIAGGKLGSIITAFIGSPITSLNPVFNTGFLVGFSEAWLRKPTVEDAERINDDIQSFRGLWTNRFTRVLIVAFGSIIGSALGAWIGMGWVLTLVSSGG